MSIDLVLTGLVQGLLLAFIAYGVMIPFRILHFSDLVGEGAYPLGGALCAWGMINGASPVIALILAMVGSGSMGLITGFLYTRFHMNGLLSGIILSAMAYSANLRLLGGPNVPLFDCPTLFNTKVGLSSSTIKGLGILGILLALLLIVFGFFLKTEYGLRLRAVGFNPEFSRRQSVRVPKYRMGGLFVASCFTGLGGGLVVQFQNYMDVGMGIGIVIHGLAALMMGEMFLGSKSIYHILLAPLAGALVYQQTQGMVLSLGLAPSDLKFFTGLMVLGMMAFQRQLGLLGGKKL
jgi:putative tryptophan/tyrosine transport system permease protein